MSKPDYERIYLVPEDGIWCWAGTPAPGSGQSNADAVEYVRADLHQALAAQVEKLKERNRKLDVDLLRALFYAPSSPVSPDKAYEIEVWYGKFKQVHLASKEGES